MKINQHTLIGIVILLISISLILFAVFFLQPQTEINSPNIEYPENPPTYNCGNGICEPEEYLINGNKLTIYCPQDCDPCEINPPICNNGICEVYCGIDEFETCPQDCGSYQDPTEPPTTNEEIINSLQQKVRPLTSGLQTQHQRQGELYSNCSLGAIVTKNNKKYILTAGHCVTKGTDGFPDLEDIGLWTKQGNEIIGYVNTIDLSGGIDAALISINDNIPTTTQNFLGQEISGFGTIYEGQKVFKLGAITGLTYGTITNINVNYLDKYGNPIRGYKITGDNGNFCLGGDSGSAVVTVSTPHKIVGILSTGGGLICNSNYPEDIKSKMGIQ